MKRMIPLDRIPKSDQIQFALRTRVRYIGDKKHTYYTIIIPEKFVQRLRWSGGRRLHIFMDDSNKRIIIQKHRKMI